MIILHKKMTIFPESGKSVNVNTDRALHFYRFSSIPIYKIIFSWYFPLSVNKEISPVLILHFTPQ